MKAFSEIKTLLREKSGKKLALLTLITFLVITVIVFYTVFRLFGTICLKQMDEYLAEIPEVVESTKNDLAMRSRVYEDDVLARAELGMILCEEESWLYTDTEMLARIREAVSADSVSLVDGQGKVVATTGPVSPEENFNACVQALEPRKPQVELYRVQSGNGEETKENDGRGFVRLPVKGDSKHSLVFEFPCEMVLELYKDLDDWSGVLEYILAGREAAAYVKTGDKLDGYPIDGLTEDEVSRLYGELEAVFADSGSFRKTTGGWPDKLINLLGKRYLATLMQSAEEDTEVLITYPLQTIIGNCVFIAVFITLIIGWGMVLFVVYAYRRLQQRQEREKTETVSPEWVRGAMWPGILLTLAVTLVFSYMLLQLENRSDATIAATSKRMSVQLEIDHRKAQEDTIRRTYEECYLKRAQMLAEFLKAHPEYQTRAGLAKLSALAGTEYLMRFDSAGQEVVSSNSYTGFSVDTNLSEAYKAVLLGYPHAVAGPAEDTYSGRMQLGAAVLITDGDDLPDGFLLAVYNAGNMNKELKRMSANSTVNNYTVRKGYAAAIVRNEDGSFIAHTDKQMIGLKAENYLENYQAGTNFEGFTEYDGKPVCVSASSADGKTLMFITPQRVNSYAEWVSVLGGLAVLLILLLVYYPNAGRLTALAMKEGALSPDENAEKPMAAFYGGYSLFITLFTVFTVIASCKGWWTSFQYVFSGLWSKGVHLFSIWAALFTLAITLCCVFLVKTELKYLENRLSLKSRTVPRLVSSLIGYAATFFLVFDILTMFGVNTTALLASAGIISIAAGMGAQSMAADLLAGFFMMLEGTVHVGDYVAISKLKGRVTDMGIRTITITDDGGNVVILNNSKANPICNMGREPKLPEGKPKGDGGGDDDDDD